MTTQIKNSRIGREGTSYVAVGQIWGAVVYAAGHLFAIRVRNPALGGHPATLAGMASIEGNAVNSTASISGDPSLIVFVAQAIGVSTQSQRRLESKKAVTSK